MTTKTLHTAAVALVDDMAHWRILQVASLGYKGALPDGVGEDDAEDFRETVQTIAKLAEAKVYIHAPLS